VLFSLAKSLGASLEASLPWAKYQDYLQERVKGLAGSGKGAIADRATLELGQLKPGQLTTFSYDDLRGEGTTSDPAAKPGVLKARDPQDLWKKLVSGMCWYDAPVNLPELLNTPSRHYEFACQVLIKKGMVEEDDRFYLPHYRPLPPSGDVKEYPLLLVSYQMLSLTDQYLANPPFMTKTLPDDLLKHQDLFVELHPDAAKTFGLQEADLAVLKTPQGEMPVRIHLTHAVRPGVVYIAQGLGHTAYDEYIQGKGHNATSITEVQIDPITGLGTVWATRAQLRRA
jgi:anaerobic selenocysteine-containing dehydrogenase